MTQSYYPLVWPSLGLFIWRICHFSVQGSSISILHRDSNFWNGFWLRRSEGFSALWSQDPYTLLSEFIFLDVFAPQCGFKKRWSSSSFWDPRQSPGDLGGFPGNGSVLEGIGEATSRLMNHSNSWQTCRKSSKIRTSEAFRSGPTPVWVWGRVKFEKNLPSICLPTKKLVGKHFG